MFGTVNTDAHNALSDVEAEAETLRIITKEPERVAQFI
jgi:hypothetical protein